MTETDLATAKELLQRSVMVSGMAPAAEKRAFKANIVRDDMIDLIHFRQQMCTLINSGLTLHNTSYSVKEAYVIGLLSLETVIV